MASATIRVQFGNPDGTGTNGHLSAEIDSRPVGLNGGKTTFSPGETAYLLVFKSDNVTITGAECSAGSISQQGSAVVAVTDELMFDDVDTAQLSRPARATLSQSAWYGRSLGSLTLQDDRITVRAQSKGVAVAKVSYEAEAFVYALTSPPSINGETDFSILALIKGVAA